MARRRKNINSRRCDLSQKCKLCQKDVDLCGMGEIPLRSHASENKTLISRNGLKNSLISYTNKEKITIKYRGLCK